MAIRIRDEDAAERVSMYRQGTPDENNSHRARREDRRERRAVSYLLETGYSAEDIEKLQLDRRAFAILTKKAFIEVITQGQRDRVAAAGKRQARGLNADSKWYLALAREVTSFIDTKRKGFIWGESLDELYEEIADSLNEIADSDDLCAQDIEFAVDIAVSKKFLRRQKEAEKACIDLSNVA